MICKRIFRYIMLGCLLSGNLLAQTFNNKEIVNGYMFKNDTVTFIYNNKVYTNQPNKVYVTGAFRNWDQNLNDTNWQLKPLDSINWLLKVYNPKFAKIATSTPFKFRINNGIWMEPPADATNQDGGNLVFMHGFEPISLYATVTKENLIKCTIKGLDSSQVLKLTTNDFVLMDAKGIEVKLDTNSFYKENHILNLTKISFSFYLEPKNQFDKRRVYYLQCKSLNLKNLVSYNNWFKTLESNKELGANITAKNQTSFRVFSPRATAVKLYLYKTKDDKLALDTINLAQDENGIWEITINKNLKGIWYNYTVHGFTDPGNFFYETNAVHVSDPYARVSDDSFGKCMVAEKTKPATPLKNGRPKLQDIIAYEVHVQDFTDLLPVEENLKGTIPAMAIAGLKNSLGKPIGFDYLCKLGINTVHLMPVQEMLHWPKDEWETAFKNDAYMIEQGIATENYDWGYRTSHSFAIETRYRQKNTKPGAEREQFRDLVQAFHNKGIAVIVDLVFNHTAENMDGREYLFHFNAFDKQYYYRTKNFEHIGAYGNETKSEERYFVQRLIIDQCKSLINEFGVDGFRIDLAGQTDKETLLKLKQELPADIIIYGEPWIDSNDPNYNKNPKWHWYKKDAPICYFNDDTRNTYKGPVFELVDTKLDRGWAGGNESLRDDVVKSLTCNWPTQQNINSAINYLDIHDNYALADQFALNNWDGRFGVDQDAFLIAATLLFTTPGPMVLHGGTEFMRSKGLAPLIEIEKEIPSGKLYFHGKRDTYNMRSANQFIWENIGVVGPDKLVQTTTPPKNAQPYTNSNFVLVNNAFKNFITLRKEVLQPIFNANFSKLIEPKNYYTFDTINNKSVLAYTIDNKVFVAINSGEKIFNLSKILPQDGWKLNYMQIPKGIKQTVKSTRQAGKTTLEFLMPPKSVFIFVKQ